MAVMRMAFCGGALFAGVLLGLCRGAGRVAWYSVGEPVEDAERQFC